MLKSKFSRPNLKQLFSELTFRSTAAACISTVQYSFAYSHVNTLFLGIICAGYYFSELILLRLYGLNSLYFFINVISLYK